jgi:hypothetical protein
VERVNDGFAGLCNAAGQVIGAEIVHQEADRAPVHAENGLTDATTE